MVDQGAIAPVSNETRFGSRRAGAGTSIFVVDAPSGSPSVIAMQDSGGTTRFLWFDTTGDLRTGNAVPTAPQSDGSVVGGQS